MPFHPEQLSRWFDDLSNELHAQWDNKVDDGAMTDQALRHKLMRMEAIGSVLRVLAEGQAVLTFRPKARREPAPMIYLPAEADE